MFRLVATGMAFSLSGTGSAAEPELQEVLVTAQKRLERAADLGMTIKVFGSAELNERHIEQADQIADHEVNVGLNKSFGNSNPVLVIRGVGLQDYNVNNTPTTPYYIDDVYLPSNAVADFALLDVERIELLKGPQGTLWGRNATGGAVHVVTRQPSAVPEARVAVELGSLDDRFVEAIVNEPLGETVYARVALAGNSRGDGQFRSRALDRDFGQFNRWVGRGSVLWFPRPSVRLLLSVQGARLHGDSYPFSHVGIAGPDCPISLSPATQGFGDETRCTNTTTGYSDPDGDPRTGDWNVVPATDIENSSVTANLTIDLRRFSLSSITAHQKVTFARGEDDDTSALSLLQILYRSDIESWSQEIRLASRDIGPTTWIGGVVLSRDEHGEQRVANLSSLFPGVLEQVTLRYGQRVESASAYAQVDRRIGDRTKVSVGLRRTSEDFKFRGGSAPGPGPLDAGFVGAVFPGLPAQVDVSQRSSDTSGKLSLDYRMAPELLTYVSAAKGYKSGGVFGGFGLNSAAFTPYLPETLYAVEAGLKWTRSDERLSAAATAFWYDYRDVQGQKLVTSATGALPILSNVGDARIRGVELHGEWRPNQSFEAGFGIGLLDSALLDDVMTLDSLQRPVNLKGRELPHAPHLSITGSSQYSRSFTGGYRMVASVEAFLSSAYESDLPNQAHLRQDDSILRLGGSISMRPSSEHWEVQVWGRNLTDERYVLHGNSSGIGNDLVMYNERRSYGVRLNIKLR